MRLFFYYIFCSVKNQIRKLFRTWVIALLVICLVIGGAIGGLTAFIEDMVADDDAPAGDDAWTDDPGDEDPGNEHPADEDDEPGGEWTEGMSEEEIKQVVEAIIAALLLVMVVFETLSAEKSGSNIFQMADVNLLFPSPMRPQSVLLFCLCCRMGAMIFLGIYFLIEVPMLVTTFGMTPLTAVVAVLTFAAAVMFGKLLNVLLYTLCSTCRWLKKWLRSILLGLLVVVAMGYAVTLHTQQGSPWQAAISYFSAPWSRYIPIFGWLRAIIMLAWDNQIGGVLLYALGLAAGMIGMVVLIRHIHADFYEDALAHSSEVAELMQKAEQGGTAVVTKNKKDRSERLRRDGMKYGRGANAFFFKTMYNRFRFAHGHVLTKTGETYLIATLGVILLQRLVWKTDGILIAAFVLSALTFFRALGNSLPQDVESHIFLMAPADPWAKMFWTIAGDTVNCAMDLLLPFLLAALALNGNIFAALAWLIFAVSINLYASCASTFIMLSLPVSLSKQVQQAILILFIYFGLLPTIGLLVFGFLFDAPALGALAAGVFHVVLAALFYVLSPLFLLRGRR